MRCRLLVVVCAALLLLACLQTAVDAQSFRLEAGDGIALTVETTPVVSYEVLVDGRPWLQSGVTALSSRGKLYTSSVGLRFVDAAMVADRDALLGEFQKLTLMWITAGGTAYNTSFVAYKSAPVLRFIQDFPYGVEDCSNGGNSDIVSAFPAFRTSESSDLNYLTYYNTFAVPHMAHWPDSSYPGGGGSGVPLVLYNEQLRTVLLSPASNFLVATQTYAPSLDGQFAAGILGTVESIPVGFSQDFVLFGGFGVRSTFAVWGEYLLARYKKARATFDSDLSISHLGYWTDNGAYYYYQTESNTTYQQTLLDVQVNLNATGLPVQYMQFDSWWYYKGINDGVTLWEPMPSVFPSGLNQFLLGDMPVALHNRYFAPDNLYRANYSLICEDWGCLPLDEALFEHMMSRVKPWRTFLYEQDWLVDTFLNLNCTRNNVTNAMTWLQAMGNAATRQGMTVQYCMPLPNFLLASVTVQAVNQARASDDYRPSFRQWEIGPSSMLIWALGMFPFKDDFWSNSTQPGCSTNYPRCYEPQPYLQALVAALSAGPVGPSDRIGYADPDVILRTCRATDGLLFKPDRPAIPLDSTYRVGFANASTVNVIETESDFEGVRWHYVLATEIAQPFNVTLAELQEPNQREFLAFDYFDIGAGGVRVTQQEPLVITTPNVLSDPANAVPMRYTVLAPVLPRSGWTLLGEALKYVTASRQRFAAIDDSEQRLIVEFTGTVGEVVDLSVVAPGTSKVRES
ncbi:hypothetical protein CAOG_001397 [Capsaspora owczarzaki ATCC 30864]|uniref:Uncharacterized protein n=1 Tax=Capsaspora owczarzaki (strain ATCC 30864) TaxID=595528 RepID=A0A0D2WKC0_CAPO3|nr:hypothetical protein CAOG_001397 [Capsaspora owczarzaki ATCC 30864]